MKDAHSSVRGVQNLRGSNPHHACDIPELWLHMCPEQSVLVPAVTNVRCEAGFYSFKIKHAMLPSRTLATSLVFIYMTAQVTVKFGFYLYESMKTFSLEGLHTCWIST